MTLMLLPTATRCGRCHARIRWVWSATGRRFPIDAQPHADGRHVLTLVDGRWVAERRRGYRALALAIESHELYRPHICEE